MNKNYAYRTYIKDIFLEVPKYTFRHHPYFAKKESQKIPKKRFWEFTKKKQDESIEEIFIGREKILNNFLDILFHGETNGVYLVTGYRGMGKTSFVNRVVEMYREKLKKIKSNLGHKNVKVQDIKISLAQAKLEEIDILRHIVKKLFQDIKSSKETTEERINTNQQYLLLFILTFLLLLGSIFAFSPWISKNLGIITKEILTSLVGVTVVLFTISFGITYVVFLLVKLIKYIINRLIGGKGKEVNALYEKLNNLHDRCFSSVIKENQESGGIKDIVNFFQKKSITYPIANIKEIEYEIVEILETYTEVTNKEIIFIFDELDKIEPEIDKGFYQNQQDESVKTYLNDLRERKQIIIKVLSSLKYLLTEAKARFIFIAGREMFDAALADIADRQSALSSIFHQIIYVESFLRENPLTAFPHKNSINFLIERYLEQILIPKNERSIFEINKHLANEPFLRKYAIYLNSLKSESRQINLKHDYIIKDESIIKIIFTLQNFITYLSYRSNGSPKKLIKIIEEVFVDGKTVNKSTHTDINDFSPFNEDNISIVVSNNNKGIQENNYINLSFKQQYKYGFNAYLFFPFISMQNNTLSNYSDSVLVSTPFLIDNLLKFHPFAFSAHNLELIPEILSTNKTPELRFFLEELINYLSLNHIRETESGLFHYKYFDRLHNEIAFISKIFDEESAAFNFSLDESHAIKSHISSKIKYLRGVFKDFKNKENPVIDSLTFLNDILGDSQLFDEFYEDAIIAFLDALHGIETPTPNKTPIDVFLAWMRVRLKLAMVYEKMKYYEQAMGQLGLAMNIAAKYITNDKILQNSSENEKSKTITSVSKLITLNIDKEGKIQANISDKTDDKESNVKIENKDTATIASPQIEGIKAGNDGIESNGTGRTNRKNESSPLYREILHITQQSILASMYVQEKFAEGLTFAKLENYLQLYADIHKHESYTGYNGRDLMMSNFYAHLGTLLFYKNKTLPYRTTLAISEEKKKNIGNNNETAPGIIENIYIKNATELIKNTPLFSSGTKHDTVLFDKYASISFNEIGFFTPDYGTGNNESYYRDFRFSFTTYVIYKKSLATILASDEKEEEIKLENLINESVKLLMNFRNVHGSRKLIGLANLITKIADLLLTLFRIDETKPINPDEILKNLRTNFKAFDNKEHSLITKLDYSAFGDGVNNEYGFVETWDNITKVNINYILLMYYLSGRLYLKAGRGVTAAFQFKKILLSIHNCKPFGKINDKTHLDALKKLNLFLENTLLKKILEITSWNSSSSDRPQISANKYITGLKNISLPPELTRKFYINLSNNPDTKEAILLFSNLTLRTYIDIQSINNLNSTIKELNLINSYNSISHQIVRIMELSMQVRINRLILARLINTKLIIKKIQVSNNPEEDVEFNFLGSSTPKMYNWENGLYQAAYKYNPESDSFNDITKDDELNKKIIEQVFQYFSIFEDADEILEASQRKLDYFEAYTDIIVNSLFCLHQIITGLNLYGINYMQNYSYLASFHERMGDWLKHYGFCKLIKTKIKINKDKGNPRVLEILNKMTDNIEKMIGNNSIRNIEDTLSHYQLAFQYYTKAVQMHSEGAAYKSQLNNLIYLEDDYNDNLNHFGAALERQQINSGKIRAKMQKLEQELQISRLYKFGNYVHE